MEKKPKDMTIKELKREIENMKTKDIDPTLLVAEIYKKIARSFSPLSFLLVGLPIAFLVKRGDKMTSYGISIAVAISYYLLQLGGEALTFRGILPPAIGANIANAIMLALGIFLIHKTVHY